MLFLYHEVSENLPSSLPFSPEHWEYRGILEVSAKDLFINNTDFLAYEESYRHLVNYSIMVKHPEYESWSAVFI